MKIIKIHYFDTYEIFQGNRRFTKLGFEVEINEDFDNVRDCYYTLKRKSEELFYESTKAAEKQKQSEEKPIVGNLINDIGTCNDLKVLETYKILVKNKPDLEAAYNNQFKKLTQ